MSAQRTSTSQPYISRIGLYGLDAIDLLPGAVVFVVGPNNGGKSTFLNEIQARLSHVSSTKWIESVEWDLGSREEWATYADKHFRVDEVDDRFLRDRATGNQVGKKDIQNFYDTNKTQTPSFLVRLLNAQNRIGLADSTGSPDVIARTKLHPYHTFFFDTDLEASFSKRIKSAFGQDFRTNRTGAHVVGHLGKAPSGNRLSTEYEQAILEGMDPVQNAGDGIRSYTGILLNSVADARPVTVIDEPEAFLHPPQARRLGHEMSLAAKENGQQVFVAKHSSDFIQGALTAKNPNTLFLYLNHADKSRKIFTVSRETVETFSGKPFLAHTNAMDALFYDQAIVCEGEADIMFFKWALEGSSTGKRLQESFWISSYGKSAIPGIFADMIKLGVKTCCVFDLDVLLSPDILYKVCELVGVDFNKYGSLLSSLAKAIKVPPAAKALQNIEQIVGGIDDQADDESSRLAAIRAIKKSAESLGKSWTLKTGGLTALPKGDAYQAIVHFLELMRMKGVIILEEGEIENYVPKVGGHGQAWVRAALEDGVLDKAARVSIERQFKPIAAARKP